MNKKAKGITWLFVLWAVFNIMFWQSHSSWQKVSIDQNVLNSKVQILHVLTLLGIDLLFIWLGRLIGQQKPTLKRLVALLLKSWLIVLGSGLLLMIIGIFNQQFWRQLFYQTLLPIGQNTAPMMTGLLLGLVLITFSQELSAKSIPWLKLLLWLMLFLPTISGHDLFHWVRGSNPLLYSILMLLGSFPSKQSRRRLLTTGFISLFVALIAVAVLPVTAMLLNEINGTQLSPTRMTHAGNAFLILAAWSIVNLVYPKFQWLSSASLYRIGGTIYIAHYPLTRTLFHHLLYQLPGSNLSRLAFSLVYALAIIIVACLLVQCFAISGRLTGLNDRINRWLASFEWQQPDRWPDHFKQYLLSHWNLILALFFSYGLAALSLLAMNISRDTHWHHIIIYSLTVRNLMVLFNTLIIFACFEFLWVLTRRYWLALGTTSAIFLAWIIASALKILSRGEPIMPSKLKMVSNWFNIIKMSGKLTVIAAIVLVIFTITMIILLEHNFPQHRHINKFQLTFWLCCFPLMIFSSAGWHHEPLSTFLWGIGNDPQFYKQLWGAEANGSFVQLLNNIDIQVMKQPRGYSRSTMIKLRHRYQTEAAVINQHRHNKLADQTLIFNLSESFANPRRVPGVKLKTNPIPTISRLKQKNTGGLMLSSGYGGGTANMEYMTLTGFSTGIFASTLTTPFTQLVGGLANNPSVVGYFNHATAIHPFTGTFYNRDTVYRKFGFNRFYSLDGHYQVKHKHFLGNNTYVDDQSAYENVQDQLGRRHRGQFINLVTMQNHLPYNGLYKNNKRFLTSAPASVDKEGLKNFTIGINYTDKAVANFIKKIDQIQRPITVVFYGDHLPGLYGDLLNRHWLQLHKTDYFICSNRYARQHGAQRKLTHNTAYTAPNDFLALAAEQTNSRVNWYLALLTEVQQ